MKTDQLIELLATQAGPAPRRAVQTRLTLAAGLGALLSAAAALAALGLNPGLLAMGSALAVKLAYVAGLMFGAARLADRVSRPATAWRGAALGLAAVVLVMAAFAATVYATTAQTQRSALLLGHSWVSCSWRVAALSLPAFGAVIVAMRGLAPTRPRLAGWAAGLLAGCLGALGYALHCPEWSPLFVLVWYTLGILAPAAVGAALGPRWLRW
ncbi:MAG: DUF1109 domain-containing protein [Burkholderiales bacterium]|nr:DUF1109 family protein [Burkholderiales bacterium]MDE1926161.1 DUF1109 domain-containing protein [Burkholderiales bacterium]MDE2158048.1 DUF1109 domain-containing protein [Burkholderiales bacterium]MDE2501837.1 DUF1109 domain-containing protein [Burkholderiales bacterium]